MSSVYLVPIVTCRRVLSPHIMRNVLAICDRICSRPPAQISSDVTRGTVMDPVTLIDTCWDGAKM